MFFFRFFPLQFITRHWIGFPVLYSRSLLSIYFIHSSVFLLNPNPYDIIFILIFQMMTLSQRGGCCPGALWIFGREAFIVPGCWAKSQAVRRWSWYQSWMRNLCDALAACSNRHRASYQGQRNWEGREWTPSWHFFFLRRLSRVEGQ